MSQLCSRMRASGIKVRLDYEEIVNILLLADDIILILIIQSLKNSTRNQWKLGVWCLRKPKSSYHQKTSLPPFKTQILLRTKQFRQVSLSNILMKVPMAEEFLQDMIMGCPRNSSAVFIFMGDLAKERVVHDAKQKHTRT